MSELAIRVEHLSKQYRLGVIGTGSLKHDINRFWHTLRGKEDPYLKVGQANDRSSKAISEYVWALRDINFEVKQGEVLGIIGRNGAGKSTLLKILSKITSPTTGTISVNGRIASLLEVGTGFHPELSGRENIFLNGAILGMRKAEVQSKFDAIVDFSGVEGYIDTPVKRYSSGMYVRLAFAVAAHLEPDILIVDEVLAVGDQEFQKKALGKMKSVSSADGRTVLFVSHSMPSIRNLCTRGLLLNNGSVEFSGTSDETVDYYISNMIQFNTNNEVFITDVNRVNRRSTELKDIEFKLLRFINPKISSCYATTDEIEIEVELYANKSVSNFRLALGIDTLEEAPVGVYFHPAVLSIEKGQTKSYQIKLNKHQLAKGQYYINMSVGVGNEITGFKDYDVVSKTLFFEIAFKNSERTEMITLWERSWGVTNFQHVSINEK